jgi:hypothetical protein
VFLYYKPEPARTLGWGSPVARRLSSLGEIALLSILGELGASALLRTSARLYCHERALGGLFLLRLRGFAPGRNLFALRAHRSFLPATLFEARAQSRHQVEHSAVFDPVLGFL